MNASRKEPKAEMPAMEQASLWMARLWSDDVSEADRRACLDWRRESPEHERAWQALASVDARLCALPAHAARSALFETGRGVSRRGLLQWGGLGLLLGGLGMGAARTPLIQRQLADHATGVGESRMLTLGDGTRLTLDTDTALNVAFDAARRDVHLVRGAVLVTTGSAPDSRPLRVTTQEGTATPLGTRFSVQRHEAGTQVAVYEGRVALKPPTSGEALTLEAGQQAAIHAGRITSPQPLSGAGLARFQGRLVAERMRLDAFIHQLGRYRHGIVRCAPEIAGLRISGVFSLHDTDRTLAVLADVLSLDVVYRTPLWVTLQPR